MINVAIQKQVNCKLLKVDDFGAFLNNKQYTKWYKDWSFSTVSRFQDFETEDQTNWWFI